MQYDEITEKQIKNIKRKIVASIWEAPTKKVIECCLMLGVPMPRNLLNKFISKDFDPES